MFKVLAIRGTDLLDDAKRAEWETNLNEFEKTVDKAGLHSANVSMTTVGEAVIATFFVTKKAIVENTPYGPRQFTPRADVADLKNDGEGRIVRGPRPV